MSLYNYYPEPDFLMHYGILGMKWGHRKRGPEYEALGNGKFRVTKAGKERLSAYKRDKIADINKMFDKNTSKREAKKIRKRLQKSEVDLVNYRRAKDVPAPSSRKQAIAKVEKMTYKDMRKEMINSKRDRASMTAFAIGGLPAGIATMLMGEVEKRNWDKKQFV